MKTETRSKEVKVQDDVKHAIAWLEKEYPHGVELVTLDYRDRIEDGAQLEEIIKEGYMEDEEWIWDSQWESERYITDEYLASIDADELDDTVMDAMREWLGEHDTSTPMRDLLSNTGRALFFIETEDESVCRDYLEADEWDKQVADLKKKYAQGDSVQEREIKTVMNEQFYGAPVSFYFYADLEDLYKVLHEQKGKYITVSGAYFSTVDRAQGSNWIGDKGCFDIQMTREDFIENLFVDGNKGNGYGWDDICGGQDYDECSILTGDKKDKDITIVPAISYALKRENRLQKHWDKEKTCTFGDMKWERHKGEKHYSNNYPCGNKCETCGTFWID